MTEQPSPYFKYLMAYLLASSLIGLIYGAYTYTNEDLYTLDDDDITGEIGRNNLQTNIDPARNLTETDITGGEGKYGSGFQLTETWDAILNLLVVITYITKLILVGANPLIISGFNIIDNTVISTLVTFLVVGVNALGWILLFKFIAEKGRFG